MSATSVALNPEEDTYVDFSGSLNAGSELDDEVPVMQVDEFVITDTSDIEKDQNDLIALENKATDLIALMDSIKRTGGMTKTFALEAESILPSFPKLNQGFYTSIPTATRYSVTLEEMHKGVVALIVAGVAFVIAAIIKMVNWFLGRKDTDKENSVEESAADITAEAVEKEKAFNELEKNASDLVDLDKEAAKDVYRAVVIIDNGDGIPPTHIESLQQAIDIFFTNSEKNSHLKKFINAEDAILRDMLNGGRYSKTALGLESVLKPLSVALTNKANMLNKVIMKYIDNKGDLQAMTEMSRQLEIINEKITLPAFGKQLTIQGLADELLVARLEAESNDHFEKMSFDRIIKGVSEIYGKTKYVTYTETSAICLKQLSLLKITLNKLNKVPGGQFIDEPDTAKISSSIRQAIFSIGLEVSSTRNLLASLDMFYLRMTYFSKEIAGVALHLYETLDKNTAIKTELYPKLWENYVARAKKLRKAMQEAHSKMDKRRR